MNILHGNLFDNFWTYHAPGDLDIATSHLTPDWGLTGLTEALGPLGRGQVVLITGERYSGTTSLARSIALANAERGLQVDYFVTDHDEDEESRRIASAALGLRDGVNVEPEHGVFTPITELAGCIRVNGSRPLLLDGEDSTHAPDVVICDEIDSYVHVKNYSLKRRLVLERLRTYAQRKQCVVIAVSKEYGTSSEEEFDSAALWERYVDTHLEVMEGGDTLDVVVHQHCGQWPEQQWVSLADQRDIGRLSDIVDDLTPLPPPQQPEVTTSPDYPVELVNRRIEAALTAGFEEDRKAFLHRFHLAAVYNMHGEDVDDINIFVDKFFWDAAPVVHPMLGFDGVAWTFTEIVSCEISFLGEALYTCFTVRGPVTVNLDSYGGIITVDTQGMLVPSLRTKQ